MKQIKRTETLSATCDSCGVKGAEPVEPRLAVKILHQRGWWLGLKDEPDHCAGCTARLQASGKLPARHTTEEVIECLLPAQGA